MQNTGNQFFQAEMESGYNQEQGYELSPEFELNEFEQSTSGEASGYELSPEFEMPQYESYEMQLAQELMEVSNEAEFTDWLKRTAKRAAGAAVGFLDSPTGQQVTSTLSNIAQKTLPGAGEKAGDWLGQKGGEALGGAIGGYLGSASAGQAAGKWLGGKAGSWLGKTGGQWAADRVPSFIRFTTDTLRNIAKEIQSGNIQPSVKPIIIRAATRHYPIILKVKGTLYAKNITPQHTNGGTIGSGSQSMNNQGAGQQNMSRTNRESEYELNPEFTGETQNEGEANNQEGVFNEVTEMELASELLSVNSEAELDRFLGRLFKKVGGFVSNVARGPLGDMLKGIAKKALPIAGGALGSFIVPGAGTAIGSALGSAASNLFELELEGLSAEDKEFETAKAYVRFAGSAAQNAARMRNRNPNQAARLSVINAARRYAPGLLIRSRRYGSLYGPLYGGDNYYFNNDGDNTNGMYNQSGNYQGSDGSGNMDSSSGTWYREGNRIIIQGA